MAKKKEIIGLVVFAFILGMVILCFSPLSNSYLNKKTVEIFKKRAALDSCSVGKVSLIIFRGIIINDLLCIKKVDSNKSVRIQVPIIRIDYRLLRAFKSWRKIESSLKVTDDNSSEHKLKDKPHLLPYLYSSVFKADTLLLPCVQLLVFERAGIIVDSLGSGLASVEKISGTLHVSKENPSVLKIKISADKIIKDGLLAHKPKASIKLDGSHCVIKKFSCGYYGGKVDAGFDLDMKKNKINTGYVDLRKADLGKIYSSVIKDKGILKGKCSFVLTIDTSIAVFNSLKGSGKIELSKVSAVKIPLITKIALLLDLEKLSRLTFRKITGDFSIKKKKLSIDSLVGEGDPLSLAMSGSIEPERRYFNFETSGVFESYYKDSVSSDVWNTLIPEEEGRRSFICTIYGTPDYPSVSLDKELMQRAAKNIFEGITEDIKSMFRKKK